MATQARHFEIGMRVVARPYGAGTVVAVSESGRSWSTVSVKLDRDGTLAVYPPHCRHIRPQA